MFLKEKWTLLLLLLYMCTALKLLFGRLVLPFLLIGVCAMTVSVVYFKTHLYLRILGLSKNDEEEIM
jgi:hypothetical protein